MELGSPKEYCVAAKWGDDIFSSNLRHQSTETFASSERDIKGLLDAVPDRYNVKDAVMISSHTVKRLCNLCLTCWLWLD